MDAGQFVETVGERAGYQDADAARKAARTVLEVLSERDLKGEGANLGAQLPGEFKTLLAESSSTEKFGRDEFLRRISDKLNVTDDSAAAAARAVLSTAAAAVSDGERVDFLKRLPRDLEIYATPRE